jgi:hypothetical protein
MFAKSLKRVVLAVALCSLALTGVGCHLLLPGEAKIVFVVKSASDQSPIKGAKVEVYYTNGRGELFFSDVTDKNGLVSRTVPFGVYKIIITRTGFDAQTLDKFPIESVKVDLIEILLVPEGQVSSSASGGKKRIP